ncbi:MAG: LysM peptidoglycan-binding domain-containing protein [Ruminiclostridium sp.]|nr:LysM peptidoglycan-binding domain-containing protein [Ruminiclostridium sp.]
MEKTTIVSCSTVTHIGSDRVVNGNRIYSNGKFLQSHLIDNSQISMEASGNLFIFAISDGMDTDMEAGSRISIIDELRKFHKKAANSAKDIQVKLDELVESVQQSNNLIYSMSLGEEADIPRNTAFTGLIIFGGNLAAVNLGNCRVYKLEADIIKPMINDNRKTERLLKMGIINNEQAEILSGQQKNSGLNGNLQVKKSDVFPVKEGNGYLLCSNSLIDALSEDTVFEILSETNEPDAAADRLVREAMENGCEDNVTAMVIRIERAEEAAVSVNTAGNASPGRTHSVPARYSRIVKKKRMDIARLVSTFILVAVIAAIIFGAFTFWINFRNPNKDKEALSQNTTQPSAEPGDSTADDTIPTDSTVAEETESSTSVDVTTPDDNKGDIVIDKNTTYTVKSGDNLMKISKQFYGEEGKYTLIMKANNITNPDKIQIGQVLKIPPAGQ